jgi:hypothetical protein
VTAPFQPGNRLTEERLNVGQLIGRVVAQLKRTSTQSISNTGSSAAPSTADAIAWEAADLNLLGGWDDTVNPSRYTPQVSGWYELSGGISFATTTSGGKRGGGWYKNGSAVDGGRSQIITNSTTASGPTAVPMRTIVVDLDGVTDYVQLMATQTSGDALGTNATAAQVPTMTIKYVGPL